MGSFIFHWPHAADEVWVTGTFDNWSKSIQLEKDGSTFKKQVDVPPSDQDILYKFVVDGKWTTDHTAPTKYDDQGNANNVLKPSDLSKNPLISSVAPSSTTAALAGQQPLEKDKAQDSTVGVAPLPATSGIGNPIKLAPGEPVPNSKDITNNTVQSTVRTDKASYEKGETGVPATTSDASPSQVPKEPRGEAQVVEDKSSSGNTGLIAGAAAGGAAVVAAGGAAAYGATHSSSSEAASGVPETVTSSIDKAHVSPEAAANPEAVHEKSAMEQQLQSQVKPEESAGEPAPTATATSTATAPGTSTSIHSGTGATTAAVAGGAVAVGGAAAVGAAAYSSSTPQTSANITNPSDVPQIADENTMPAIAVANRTADPPSTTLNSKGEAVQRGDIAPNVSNQGTVEAFRDDPVSAVGSSVPAETSSTSALDPRTVASAFATDPISAEPATGTSIPANDPRTVASAFATDPISATGASIPANAPTVDPRTVAPAFATDPIGSEPAVGTIHAAPVSPHPVTTAPATTSAPGATTAPTAATPTTPATPATPANKPFAASNREREFSRDISPHSKTPVGAAGATSGTTQPSSGWAEGSDPKKQPAPAPASAAATSSAAKDKKSKRRSFLGKVKDAFKPKPAPQ